VSAPRSNTGERRSNFSGVNDRLCKGGRANLG
jgi:hypothetical protein